MSGGRSPGAPDLAQLVAELSSAVTSHLNDTSRAHGLESLLARLSTLETQPGIYILAATEEGTPDGNLLGTTTTTGGLTWLNTLSIGTLRRLSGRIVAAVGGAAGINTIDLGTGDGAAIITGRATAGNSVWVYGRYSTSGAATGLLLERSGAGLNLYKQVAGTTTQIATTPRALSGSDERIALLCIGTSVQAYVNGALVLSVTETTGQTQTGWGIRLGQGDATAYVERAEFIRRAI